MKKLMLILLLMPYTLKSLNVNGFGGENLKGHYNDILKEYIVRDRIREIKTMKFSMELLEEYLYLVDSSLMDVPIRQFILETGWFQSELFRLHNNIAGMKYPQIRRTTAIDTAMGHAKYKHWTDSVDDYIYWREHWKSRGYSTENYYQFLKDINYATSSNYEKLLKSINLKSMNGIT
jgi:flagellum-specific peptidoglycan hydrolase FlgJ